MSDWDKVMYGEAVKDFNRKAYDKLSYNDEPGYKRGWDDMVKEQMRRDHEETHRLIQEELERGYQSGKIGRPMWMILEGKKHA